MIHKSILRMCCRNMKLKNQFKSQKLKKKTWLWKLVRLESHFSCLMRFVRSHFSLILPFSQLRFKHSKHRIFWWLTQLAHCKMSQKSFRNAWKPFETDIKNHFAIKKLVNFSSQLRILDLDKNFTNQSCHLSLWGREALRFVTTWSQNAFCSKKASNTS